MLINLVNKDNDLLITFVNANQKKTHSYTASYVVLIDVVARDKCTDDEIILTKQFKSFFYNIYVMMFDSVIWDASDVVLSITFHEQT